MNEQEVKAQGFIDKSLSNCQSIEEYEKILKWIKQNVSLERRNYDNTKALGTIAAVIEMGKGLGLSWQVALGHIIPFGEGKYMIKGDQAKAMCFATYEISSWVEGSTGSVAKGDFVYTITCKRTMGAAPIEITRSFSIKEAISLGIYDPSNPKTIALKDKFWQFYPERQCYYRCLGFICRDLFPDVMKGAVIAEEAQDYSDSGTATTTDQTGKVFEHDAAAEIHTKTSAQAEKLAAPSDNWAPGPGFNEQMKAEADMDEATDKELMFNTEKPEWKAPSAEQATKGVHGGSAGLVWIAFPDNTIATRIEDKITPEERQQCRILGPAVTGQREEGMRVFMAHEKEGRGPLWPGDAQNQQQDLPSPSQPAQPLAGPTPDQIRADVKEMTGSDLFGYIKRHIPALWPLAEAIPQRKTVKALTSLLDVYLDEPGSLYAYFLKSYGDAAKPFAPEQSPEQAPAQASGLPIQTENTDIAPIPAQKQDMDQSNRLGVIWPEQNEKGNRRFAELQSIQAVLMHHDNTLLPRMQEHMLSEMTGHEFGDIEEALFAASPEFLNQVLNACL